MKKTGAFFTFLALIITALTSGCMSSPRGLNPAIKTDGNLATVAAGETLYLKASGQYITWEVSSSSGGFQPAAEGTFISQRGLLTVAVDEPALFLYVTARSARNGRSDTKQVRVVSVDAVDIIPAHQSVDVGRRSQFTAIVTGNNYPDNTVIWRVSSNAEGTGAVAWGTSINENGVLKVSAYERATVLYVFATSVLDLRVYGSVIIYVNNPVYVVHYSTPTAVYFFPSAPHSSHPNNHPYPNPPVNTPVKPPPPPKPPVSPPHNNPHAKPPEDSPRDRPHANPPEDTPKDRPHAKPPEDTPRDRPHSNPHRNNRYIEPPEDIPPVRSNPPANAPANNSRRSENRR
jgi:hypothetical protein